MLEKYFPFKILLRSFGGFFCAKALLHAAIKHIKARLKLYVRILIALKRSFDVLLARLYPFGRLSGMQSM